MCGAVKHTGVDAGVTGGNGKKASKELVEEAEKGGSGSGCGGRTTGWERTTNPNNSRRGNTNQLQGARSPSLLHHQDTFQD